MSVEKDLRSLGLSDNEVKVYLDLAEIGKSTPHLLSKRTAVARTTVYWALENLALRGLVSREQKRSTTLYSVNRPAALVRMVEQEKRKALEELSRKEALAAELTKSIAPFFQTKPINLPKLQLFEGEEGVSSLLYDHLPIWQDSIAQSDNTWWGYQDPSFAEHYFAWLQHSWKMRRKNEVYKNLTNEAPAEKHIKVIAPKFREMKYIPEQYQFSSTIWAVGDYIVLIMTSQRPHYAFQLHDKVFAESLRMVFRILHEMRF